MPQYMRAVNVMANDRLAYQPEKINFSLKTCKSKRVAVDIGAHVGTWSFRLADEFETVHAFEPIKEHCECFVLNAPKAVLHNCALGHREGEARFVVTEGNSGNTHVESLKGEGDVVAELKTLDSFGLENVDFIKVDCEGYEHIALLGAIKTILKYRPVICVEQKNLASRYGNGVREAVAMLEKMGYKTEKVISGDYIMVVNG